MTNRYGNFRNGKYLFVHADWVVGQIGEKYPGYRSDGSLMPELPKTDTKFDYSGISGGIWDLSSTYQFPKNNNRTTQIGLTDPLHVSLIVQDYVTYTQNTVNISRYPNRSARVVFQYLLKGSPATPADGIIDAINISGTTYGFEASGENWQTTTTNAQGTPYQSLAWTTIASTRTRDRFARSNTTTIIANAFGPGAIPQVNGNFGLVTTYDTVYGEPPYHMTWIRSPVVSLGASPTLSYQYFNVYSNFESAIYTYLDLQ